MKKIGVDLGGTHLRVGIFQNNKLKKYVKEKTPKSGKEIQKLLVELIEKFIEKDVKRIGVSSAGPLEKGIIKNPPNLPFKNFNLKKFLQSKFKRKIEVENDASCVGLAELNNRKEKNFIILTLGTGIGGGIVINNQVYNGKGLGSELGHIIIDNGKDLEQLAGGKALKKYSKKEFGKELYIKDLIKINNSKARKIIKKEVNYLSDGVASLINIFDPECVIIAGGFSEGGKKFLSKLKTQVYKKIIIKRKTKIVYSKFREPGLIGASYLV